MNFVSKPSYAVLALLGILTFAAGSGQTFAAEKESGEVHFKEHCAGCHPGPQMTPFDEKTLPDKEAHLIAEYILKTFK